MFVGDYNLSLEMNTTEFKEYFKDEVRRRLGKEVLKRLNLDVNKVYRPAVAVK